MQEAPQIDVGEVEAEAEGALERQSPARVLPRPRPHAREPAGLGARARPALRAHDGVLVRRVPDDGAQLPRAARRARARGGRLERSDPAPGADAAGDGHVGRVADDDRAHRRRGSGRRRGARRGPELRAGRRARRCSPRCIGGLFPEALVRLVAFDPEVIALATVYVRIVFLTFFALISGQIFASVLNGAGDTTTPMMTSFVGHAGRDLLRVVTHLRPRRPARRWASPGIPLGSALGGACGAAHLVLHAVQRALPRAPAAAPPGARPGALWRLVSVAWQPAFHMLARSLMIMFFMIMAGHLGGKVQAAYTVGLRSRCSRSCSPSRSRTRARRWSGRTWARATSRAPGGDLGQLGGRAGGALAAGARRVLVPTPDRVAASCDDPEVAAMASRVPGLLVVDPGLLRPLLRRVPHAAGVGRHELADDHLGGLGGAGRRAARLLPVDAGRSRARRGCGSRTWSTRC